LHDQSLAGQYASWAIEFHKVGTWAKLPGIQNHLRFFACYTVAGHLLACNIQHAQRSNSWLQLKPALLQWNLLLLLHGALLGESRQCFPTGAANASLCAMKFSVSEISELIRHRRTIYPKDYSAREVQREIVERVLTNATWAPTHGLTQPWRFTVFSGAARERLSQFLGETYRAQTPPEKFLQKKFDNVTQRPLQSTVVIGIGMARDPKGKINERDELLAVACAVQNMHLTCAAYGLGAFWATGGPMTGSAMRDFLGLQDGDQAMGLFYIGYPASEWPSGHRRPLETVTTWLSA